MYGPLPGLIFIQRIKTWLADTHIQLSIDLFIPISPLSQRKILQTMCIFRYSERKKPRP